MSSSITNSQTNSTFGAKWQRFNASLQLKKASLISSLEDKVVDTVLKNIFGKQELTKTHNHANPKDIPLYLQYMEKPIEIKSLKVEVMKKGFTIQKQHLTLEPFGEGVCLGDSLCFAKKWAQILTDSPPTTAEEAKKAILELAKQFEDGAPFEATLIQAYTDVLHDHGRVCYDKDLAAVVETIFSEYPNIKTDSDRKVYWDQIDTYFSTMFQFSCGPLLAQGIRAFVESGKTVDQGFSSYIDAYFENAHEKLPPIIYSTLREMEGAAELRNGKSYETQLAFDRHYVVGNFIGLEVEKTHFMDATPDEVLEGMAQFQPGLYLIATPSYGLAGKKEGAHAILFYKYNDELSFILDPNFAIGAAQGAQQKALWKKVLYCYVGEATSKAPEGSEKITRAFKKFRNGLSMTDEAQLGKVSGLSVRRLKLAP